MPESFLVPGRNSCLALAPPTSDGLKPWTIRAGIVELGCSDDDDDDGTHQVSLSTLKASP